MSQKKRKSIFSLKSNRETIEILKRNIKILDGKLVECSDLLIKATSDNLDLRLENGNLADSLRLAAKHICESLHACNECPVFDITNDCGGENEKDNRMCVELIKEYLKEEGEGIAE